MWILGITHPGSLNGAVCLVKDGEIIAAIEEERVSRIKRAAGLIPHNSIEFVLKKAGIVKEDIEKIAVGGTGLGDDFEKYKNAGIGSGLPRTFEASSSMHSRLSNNFIK